MDSYSLFTYASWGLIAAPYFQPRHFQQNQENLRMSILGGDKPTPISQYVSVVSDHRKRMLMF